MTKARDNATQGGLTLISNTSFSAVSSVTVDNLLTNNVYKITCKFNNTSNSGNYFVLRKNNADVTGGYYGASFYSMYNNSTGNGGAYNSASSTWLGYGTITFDYTLHTNGGNGSTVMGINYDANYGRASFTAFETNTNYNATGFKFYPAAGTITGNIQIYLFK